MSDNTTFHYYQESSKREREREREWGKKLKFCNITLCVLFIERVGNDC